MRSNETELERKFLAFVCLFVALRIVHFHYKNVVISHE